MISRGLQPLIPGRWDLCSLFHILRAILGGPEVTQEQQVPQRR